MTYKPDVPDEDHDWDTDMEDMKENFNHIETRLVPSGVILMWSGATDDVPEGWVLCDGNNDTPDLRDRFIVGAGDNYNVDDTGGKKEVSLTEGELAPHDHTGSTSTDGAHTDHVHTSSRGTYEHNFSDGGGSGDEGSFTDTVTNGDHNHSFTTDDAGGGEAHENRPPYYALAFIMKE